jgi:hypothetical protein
LEQVQNSQPTSQLISQKAIQQFQPIQRPQPTPSFQQTNQQISGYPPQQKSSKKGIIIVLIVLLVVLLGVLGATIFFKEQIVNFFNGA